jgi:hypothetical protein
VRENTSRWSAPPYPSRATVPPGWDREENRWYERDNYAPTNGRPRWWPAFANTSHVDIRFPEVLAAARVTNRAGVMWTETGFVDGQRQNGTK